MSEKTFVSWDRNDFVKMLPLIQTRNPVIMPETIIDSFWLDAKIFLAIISGSLQLAHAAVAGSVPAGESGD